MAQPQNSALPFAPGSLAQTVFPGRPDHVPRGTERADRAFRVAPHLYDAEFERDHVGEVRPTLGKCQLRAPVRAALRLGEIEPDPAQELAAKHLQEVADELAGWKPDRGGLFSVFRRGNGRP